MTEVHDVGALGAAIIVGHTGDIGRFPDAGHYARYNGTAPIEASSALKNRMTSSSLMCCLLRLRAPT